MTSTASDTPADTTGATAPAPAETATARGQSATSTRPPSRIFGWDKGNLAITDEEQRERYRRPTLSPSTAKAMDGCPARWAAEKALGQAENPFGAAELGTSAHSVLEDLYNVDLVKPKDRTPETAMAILLRHSKEAWPGKDADTFAKRGLWISAVHDAYKGIFECENPAEVAVHSIELGIGTPGGKEVEINGVPFIGYIDRVDYTPEGLRPVDYKSSAKKPVLKWGDDHGDQVRLYAEVLRVVEGRMPTTAALHYTRLGQARIVNLKPADMRKVLAKFKKSWISLNRYIDEGAFPTQSSPLCGWCPLVNACPTAAANGFVARVDGVASKVDLGIPVLRTYEAGDLHAMEGARAKTPRPSMDFDFGSASTSEVAYVPNPTVEPVDALDVLGDADITDDPAYDPTADPDYVPVEPSAPDFAVPEALVAAAPGTAADSRDTDAATGSEPASTAHLEEATNHPAPAGNAKENAMSDLLVEDKPWIETVRGNLNPASYAATAVFGLTALAYSEIHKANMKPTKEIMDGLSQTFAYMVASVQDPLTGLQSFQEAAHTRLRGALHTYIDANPLPFGKGRAEWDEWVALGVKHMRAIALTALRLYEADLTTSPWLVLSASADDDFASASA